MDSRWDGGGGTVQLAPPARPAGHGRARGRRSRKPSVRSTRALTNVMVLLFILGGVGIARPSLLEVLPDLDWDPRSALELFQGPDDEQPDVLEGASG